MKYGRLLLGTMALLGSLSCLIWPFPAGGLISGRGRINPQYAEPLAIGQSTREEVLLRLGEPDEALESGTIFLYRWTEVRGFIVFGGYGSAVAVPFPGHRNLRLEFDGTGRLTHKSFSKRVVEKSSPGR